MSSPRPKKAPTPGAPATQPVHAAAPCDHGRAEGQAERQAEGQNDGADEAHQGSELRCTCGSLLARYVGGKVELKCRRCKRTMWISVSAEGEPES